MEKEKISIIIPIYQVADYLPKCLNTVLAQTYHNLEILLIDDGSPDDCGRICDRYAKKDSRIRVLHKQNEGVAMARNDGLALATGDYICFMDSDDWMAKDALKNLYYNLKTYDADCAVGHCVTVLDKNGVLMPKMKSASPTHCERAEDVMKHTLLYASAIWNRLFKREVFDNLQFPVGRINDDEVTALHAYAKCKRIVFLEQDTYFYRIRPNSITTSKFSLKHLDYYYNSKDNLAFIKKAKPELTACAEYKTYKSLLYCYLHLRRMKSDSKAKKFQRVLHNEIHRVRSKAYRNPYMTLPLKFAFVYSSIF